jgi:putative intracellular protease/amidase
MAQPRILIVTTSNARLGDGGKPTGLWLEELATPYFVLRDAGVDITLTSIRGGEIPLDPRSVEGDDVPASAQRFLADGTLRAAIRDSLPVEAMRGEDFDAVFLPGGHGTMWDLPDSVRLARLVGEADAAGRIVSAVCHGPAGLVAARRADGRPLVEGRKVTAFTNAEEDAVGLRDAVPFLLETRLRELGARFESAPVFQPHAVRDGALITGQNPASSGPVAKLVVEALA